MGFEPVECRLGCRVRLWYVLRVKVPVVSALRAELEMAWGVKAFSEPAGVKCFMVSSEFIP